MDTSEPEFLDDDENGDDWGSREDRHARMAEMYGSSGPRERYFQTHNGPLFGWTTTRDHEDWFWSFVCYPTGPGRPKWEPFAVDALTAIVP